MPKEYCRDKFFPTKHIENLPRLVTFSEGKKTLLIDYASTDQLDACRKVIDESAKRGDNVGKGEWPEGSYTTKLLFDLSEIFIATDRTTGGIEAFMFIQYCLYQRSLDSCSATVHIFRSDSIDDSVYAELATLMGEFANLLNLGYTQVCTQVALCLPSLYMELRKQGFLTVIVLPDWVEIAGIGVRENGLMIKSLESTDRQIKSKEEVSQLLGKVYDPTKSLNEYTNKSIQLISGLPLTLTASDGTKFLFRNRRLEEDVVLFEMVNDATENGVGFSVHDIPTLDLFRVGFLATSYTAVIEQEDTKDVVGFLLFQDAVQYRREKGKICETTIVLKASIRGKGLGSATQEMFAMIGRSLGYESELRMTYMNSKLALGTSRRAGFHFIGMFPRGGYLRNIGWTDLVFGIHKYTKNTGDENLSEKQQIITDGSGTASKL